MFGTATAQPHHLSVSSIMAIDLQRSYAGANQEGDTVPINHNIPRCRCTGFVGCVGESCLETDDFVKSRMDFDRACSPNAKGNLRPSRSLISPDLAGIISYEV